MESNDYRQFVNSRGWKNLPPAELENLILKIRREAVTRHLDEREWRMIDRMRKHLRHAPEVSHD
jgi:hypothetical protein